jgi:glucose-6-phosphate dehydrogenase assembly protein OpcA
MWNADKLYNENKLKIVKFENKNRNINERIPVPYMRTRQRTAKILETVETANRCKTHQRNATSIHK